MENLKIVMLTILVFREGMLVTSKVSCFLTIIYRWVPPPLKDTALTRYTTQNVQRQPKTQPHTYSHTRRHTHTEITESNPASGPPKIES